MGASVMSRLEELARVVTAPNDSEETLVELAPEAEIIFTCYAPITARVITVAERLRGIVKYGVGIDSIDTETAARRAIPVINCPDYGTETVADHAFALMIALARKLTAIDRAMREDGWLWPEPEFRGVDLAGKTLGLIGLGRIGKAMARRAAGFGMKLLAYDPYVTQAIDEWQDLDFVKLEDLLPRADFVSLHCVLTPETRHLIGLEELRLMRDSAFLINVSRGALVDAEDLVGALGTGEIAGAGLDVYPEEPLTRENPLFALENVILTPHLAFYTKEAYERLEKDCLRKIERLL